MKFSYASHKAVDEFKEAKAVSVLTLSIFHTWDAVSFASIVENSGVNKVGIAAFSFP